MTSASGRRWLTALATAWDAAGMTKLEGPLRRELAIGGEPYVLTIDPDRLRLVPKGRRKGRELAWRDLVSGEAALAVALNASLAETRGASSPGVPMRRHPGTKRRT